MARAVLSQPTLWQRLTIMNPWSLVWIITFIFLGLLCTALIGASIINGWAPKDRVVYRKDNSVYTKPGEQPHDSKAARIVAHKVCNSYAQTFDVQDQAVLVYACSDGKLRVMTYLPGNG